MVLLPTTKDFCNCRTKGFGSWIPFGLTVQKSRTSLRYQAYGSHGQSPLWNLLNLGTLICLDPFLLLHVFHFSCYVNLFSNLTALKGARAKEGYLGNLYTIAFSPIRLHTPFYNKYFVLPLTIWNEIHKNYNLPTLLLYVIFQSQMDTGGL